MTDQIVTIEQLQLLSGLKRRSAIKRWLSDNGVLFFVQANGNPSTTLDAINRALCGGGKANEPDYSQPLNHRSRRANR